MSTTAPQPVTTPSPVQLSAPEFEAFILPHLSMPKRGPKCKMGYYRVFNLILRVLAAPGKFEAEICAPTAQECLSNLLALSIILPRTSQVLLLYTGMQWKCLPIPHSARFSGNALNF